MSRSRDLSKLSKHLITNTDTTSGVMVRINEQTMTSNLTIESTENAMMTGPVTLANNVFLTINGHLSIV